MIRVSVDGRDLLAIENDTFPTGQATVGCGYHPARLDALEIDCGQTCPPECARLAVQDERLNFEGGWEALTGDYRYHYRSARRAGTDARLSFSPEGTGFAVMGRKTEGLSLRAVIDGRECTALPAKDEGFRRCLFSVYGLPAGKHHAALYPSEGLIVDSVDIFL